MLQNETFEDRHWLPRLVDIIHFANEGDEDERLYFSRFGFDQLVIPEDCPIIQSRMAGLTLRFNDRYLFRRIAQETMPRWQTRMQVRMDAIAHRYERAYELYQRYQEQMDSDVVEGERSTVTGQRSKLTGSDRRTVSASNTNTVKNIDTPDSAVNASDNYADSLTKSNGNASSDDTTTYGRQDDVALATLREYTGRQIMENINLSIEDWKDIDTLLIGEFENMFVNVFE